MYLLNASRFDVCVLESKGEILIWGINIFKFGNIVVQTELFFSLGFCGLNFVIPRIYSYAYDN